MRNLYILLVSLLVLSTLSVQAQDKASKRAYRKGSVYYKRSDYIRAVPFLKEAHNLDPENAQYAFMLGKSIFLGDQPREALKYLTTAYNLDRTVDGDLDYLMARSLHHNGFFEEAISHYQADLSNYTGKDEWRKIDNEARILQCQHAPAVVGNALQFQIKNLGEFVNGPYPEYAATYSGNYDYMIFTTRRPRKLTQMVRRRYHSEDINEEVYEASLLNGEWVRSRIFAKPIPRWQHDASIALSPDGNTLIYYIDRRNNHGDVYVSTKGEDGKWSKRASIGENINSKAFNEPSVSFSQDGQTLFWVSDRTGGAGLKDIYVSTKDANGAWGEGRNLSQLNTPYDDDAPFISADGRTLYFSSRGHNSIGGYDIFVSKLMPNGDWGQPENIGYPINSFGDDIYFVKQEGSEGFYFTSDRPGGFGEKDLYYGEPSLIEAKPNTTVVAGLVSDQISGDPLVAEVELLDGRTGKTVAITTTDPKGRYRFQLPNCGQEYAVNVRVPAGRAAPLVETGSYHVVSGRVEDAFTTMPLGAVLELVDPTTNTVVESASSNPATGNYMFLVESGRNYMIRARSDEYLPFYEEFSVAPNGQLDAHYDIIGLQKQNEPNKLVITWQFFDTDKFVIKSDYLKDLDNVIAVLNKVPEMNLNIIGHTDSDASEEYNVKLSEGRAKSVADYLVSKGIDPKRLNTAGLGESMPIYPNEGETKKWNRRVELFLIPRK
jgi:outer membrane protein OmpA-like peptidoglycan-associated protein